MGAHAKLSPSSASIWMECPGSAALTAGLPDSDSVYSREGTFAHSVAADLLIADETHAITKIGASDGEFTVDAEMAKHIQPYLDVVYRLVIETDGELLIEQRVDVTEEVWGTADAIIVGSDGTLHVVDLKFGQGILVDADHNKQLLIYAIGALGKIGEEKAKKVKHVTVHIVQPRRPDGDGEVHREFTLQTRELVDFAERVLEAAALTETSFELKPGDHCQWCKAKATCPALHERALAAAGDVFKDGDPTQLVKPPSPVNLTPAEIAKILPNLDIVEKWIGAMRDYAEHLLKTGVKVPGYKLVDKIGNRRWIDEEKAAAELRAWGVDPFDIRIISPAKAEAANKAIKAAVAEITHRPITGVTIAPAGDKRPETNAKIGDVFAE